MEQIQNIITLIIAIYGAILATLGFVLSIILGVNELRKEHPKIKVKFSFGRLIIHNGKNSESLILFEAQNVRKLPVLITGCGWLHKKGNKSQIVYPYLLDLPQMLDSRRKVTAYYACRWFQDFKNQQDIIGFYFTDEESNIWKVRVTEKQIQSWKNIKNDGDYLIEWDEKLNQYDIKEKDKN